MRTKKTLAAAMVFGTVLVSGCRIESDKHGAGDDVKIATPFGGLHVKTDDSAVLEGIGLPAYPGAELVKKDKSDGAADVNLSFGQFQLRIGGEVLRAIGARAAALRIGMNNLTQPLLLAGGVVCLGGHLRQPLAHLDGIGHRRGVLGNLSLQHRNGLYLVAGLAIQIRRSRKCLAAHGLFLGRIAGDMFELCRGIAGPVRFGVCHRQLAGDILSVRRRILLAVRRQYGDGLVPLLLID